MYWAQGTLDEALDGREDVGCWEEDVCCWEEELKTLALGVVFSLTLSLVFLVFRFGWVWPFGLGQAMDTASWRRDQGVAEGEGLR